MMNSFTQTTQTTHTRNIAPQLLPEPAAQAQFTHWLQQSASEQQLIDRVQKQRAALASASASGATAGAGAKGLPPGLAGPGPGGAGGAGSGSGAGAPCIDPLGLNNNLDLVSAEQAQPKSSMPGGAGGKGGGGALLGAKDRMFLLQRLQQAALGGGGSGGSSQGAGAAGPGKGAAAAGGKYTRNKARALKSAAATSVTGAGSGVGVGAGGAAASIVPQDEAFDPLLFLTVIHGGSTFEDLRRGQENLEKGLGTQAGQLQRLVLEHYDAFARCAEGIQWFRHMVEEEFFREAAASATASQGGSKGNNSGGGEGAKIAHLLEIVAGTQAGAKELFRPLLERMDRAKGLRSARLLLQRLARVLDVPGWMAKLEAQGKYEEVVREYERVRALPSGVGLLGRVQHQAEAVADRLRARLRAFVGAEAHPFEELVQAAELLVRLGPGKGTGMDEEPLLFAFARQAEVLGKGLDALEAWYGKGLQAVGEQEQREGVRRQLMMQQQQQQQAPISSSPSPGAAMQQRAAVGWKQRSFHSSGDGDATDEEEDGEEEGGAEGGAGGGLLPGRSHSHGSHGDGDEEDGGEDDDDSMEDDDSLAAASAAAAAVMGGTGLLLGDEIGGEEDPLLASPMRGSRRGDPREWGSGRGLDFSTGFGLESVKHRASALRLQYARRLVRLALRSLPTLLRLAALVAEELPDVRVRWEAGHYAFHVVFSSGAGGGGGARDRAGSQLQQLRLATGGGGGGGEVTAASGALDQVTLALQRISKAARRAIFGEPGGAQPPRSPKQARSGAEAASMSVRHRPLHPVYFREALRAVALLYEGVFALQQDADALAPGGGSSTTAAGLADTTAGLAKAVLPSLRALVEDAQRAQAQSVLDRLGEEAARLGQREDWAKCAFSFASAPPPPAGVVAGGVGSGGWWPLLALAPEEDHAAVNPRALKGSTSMPGTSLPRAFLELATAALEDLAATLPRPFWCAEQAAAGLDAALARLLAAMAALGAADDDTKPAALAPPRPLRLLALVGNCIQLHAAVLPLLAAAARRLFEAEQPSLAGPGAKGRVLALHDDCLRLYLEGKAAALDAALADGWVVKAKSLRGALSSPFSSPPPTGAGGSSPAAITPPAYLSRVLLLLVQAKAEAQELLGERAVLAEDEDEEENGDEGEEGRLSYVDAVMRRLAQVSVQGLTTRAAELTQALAGAMKQLQSMAAGSGGGRRRGGVVVGALAHCAYVEATFLLSGPLKAFVPPERVEAVRTKGLAPLKALAIEGLVGGGGEEDGGDEDEEGARVMEYTAESVGRALRVYVASV